MKQIFALIVIVMLFVIACSTQKGVIQVKKSEGETVSQDSIEYELETFDHQFETWYQLYKSPALYRSQSYYESWNRRYVTAWNLNITAPGKRWFFEPIIGYDPTVDYGFEINHELFYYFQYVERVLKIEIIPGGGPRVTPF